MVSTRLVIGAVVVSGEMVVTAWRRATRNGRVGGVVSDTAVTYKIVSHARTAEYADDRGCAEAVGRSNDA